VRALTIIVPAYNEERHIAAAIDAVIRAADRHLDDYEVIVVDDASTDETGRIADGIAGRTRRVRVIHQPTNRGVGAAYQLCLAQAKYGSITLVPGDNAFSEAALDSVFASVNVAPLVVSYRANMEVRTRLRRLLSTWCTTLMRLITGKAIRDAQSMFIFPVDVARKCATESSGYGYHSYALEKNNSRTHDAGICIRIVGLRLSHRGFRPLARHLSHFPSSARHSKPGAGCKFPRHASASYFSPGHNYAAPRGVALHHIPTVARINLDCRQAFSSGKKPGIFRFNTVANSSNSQPPIAGLDFR